ncbi:type I phosphomannose isomerase catalytic subunit [Geotoga petraea]|jgi:mannose-6-phosphate isomerase|uniref:Mannose-6-phosphate isomerase, type 1 n=1 Tax=Geotoga petraea TaxID=28234 RepID=A0A1G6L239_9BACT|nr:type I phosphomannose isomerase catalytic subunit [Geotoga petraea]MDK2946664.1 mannose-6-phosphate isomerase [Geotoga sp.]SDC37400.1 mannose-6-phosphate isomerase, type 1 [Geotoga petraea]
MIKEPLITRPIFSEKVWGNRKLNDVFDKGNENSIGEVWLYSDVKNRETELIGMSTGKIYGYPSEIFPGIPLLLKLLGTSSWLSVQVHPDDEFARKVENQKWGKTECWYFIENNGKIKISNDNEGVKKALEDNNWEDVLEDYEMNKFDSVFLPAGTVHTLGPNSFLLEIQQSSDMTYRLYDWGRPREIHVEKAKKVMESINTSYSISRETQGIESKYFSFKKFKDETKKGFGIYLSLKDFTTIVLPDGIDHNFQGEWIEYKLNKNGWK